MHISYILWNRNSNFGMLMHLGMPECHKLFWGHCDLDLWPSFQELLCPEHICYIIWCRNPKFGVVIPLGMAEWCIPFWGTSTLALTSGLISRFFVLYYSYLSSNVSYARPIPLGAFVTCLWHFLLFFLLKLSFRNISRVPSRLDPDHARRFVGTDLGPNCLQR